MKINFRKIISILILLFIGTILSVFIIGRIIGYIDKRKIQKEIYDKIQIGTNKKELLRIYGKPQLYGDSSIFVNLPDSLESLIYYTDRSDSLPYLFRSATIYIRVNKNTDQVVRVFVDND